MKIFLTRKGSLSVWALTISVAAHLVLIAVFATVKVTANSEASQPPAASNVTAARIEQVIQSSPTIPKPKVTGSSYTPPKTTAQPLNLSPVNSALPVFSNNTQTQMPSRSSDTFSLPAANPSSTVEFFGSLSDQRKICYVVDCSNSMQGMLGQLKKQLTTSISNLRPDQFFYIIFVRQGTDKLESGTGRLTRATPQAKAKAIKFINKAKLAMPAIASNALVRAMQITDNAKNPPGVIYFLTDGFDLQPAESAKFTETVESTRKRLAPDTRINTIGFWAQPDDSNILKTIAQKSGGVFTSIE